jgi:hypothetical protein
MSQHGAGRADIENVEAWAEVVEDLLYRAPTSIRAEILAAAATKERQAAEQRQTSGGFVLQSFDSDWMNSPGIRHWNTIMRLKALVIQAFARPRP